ncbi:pyridine nucleotide-disulfide oxidoreductase [Hirsutella rhossiliensis]|uniref:Pyridine nucleotide-disulfide oxidoreductase domain-containing protein n=1 Tax=Hirsutella rhossiliensis TaxID=111463 RepID=A0A9P8N5G9_9HYPO|nr:pyridine nucleotide-disulfide oxidoreductase domain-containing protein [Hirsutella rhossiliensis]KAH0967993.1 pyridine nucleotide-disulfide oxidoreductase domain-containing protein [Hirsutella rhossiliensis]
MAVSASDGHEMPDLGCIMGKYEEEKKKRLRADGSAQYIDLELEPAGPLSNLAQDPWVDHETLNAQAPNLADGDDIKLLILGAGFGGLLHAVRLVEAGFAPGDVRIVDTAGGFGGTWYWNRYPGLMCDVESSIYLPLLEEMGYTPKHRFSYGPEIRRHAEAIAVHWRLADKAVFRTHARSLAWDEDASRWRVCLAQARGLAKSDVVNMNVCAQFVVLANGVLNHPKAPKIPGIGDFAGPMMHTGRWDYGISGGSPDNASLMGFKGKRVGIIGTGATAVQCVPELAKWAGHVLVFQRTPSAVDERGQRETDPEAWQAMTASPGWWRARNNNWNSIICGYPAEDNLVNDAWSAIGAYKHLVGGPHEQPVGLQGVVGLIQRALAIDAPRMERLRRRVDDIVTKDAATAEALKAWYPSWCKRPCFHDDYLATFNRSNVTLVDTAAKGVERFTRTGVVVGGQEHELDIVVLATGYRSPSTDMGEPSGVSNATITGCAGAQLASKWLYQGATTLHGILTHGFPNLILMGPAQVGVSANFVYGLDNLAKHVAYVLSEALARAPDQARAVVEATEQGEAEWTERILTRSAWMAPLGICGPSYFNNESDPAQSSPEEQTKSARGAYYPQGIIEYEEVLERWRREGSMHGLLVR